MKNMKIGVLVTTLLALATGRSVPGPATNPCAGKKAYEEYFLEDCVSCICKPGKPEY